MLAKETQVKTRVQLWLIVYVSQYACGGRGEEKAWPCHILISDFLHLKL